MSKQILQKLWVDLGRARRRLAKILPQAYGEHLNLLMPDALQFLKTEAQDFELRRLLFTVARTIEEAGTILPGGEYRLPMTRNLLSLMVVEHGWTPSKLPLLPNALPLDPDAEDALYQVRDLRDELGKQKRLFRENAQSPIEDQQR